VRAIVRKLVLIVKDEFRLLNRFKPLKVSAIAL